MCIDRERWEKFEKQMTKDVGDLMHDMKGIRTSQQALGELGKQTEQHLRKLNSRTSKIEARTNTLEDPEYREVRCVQRETVDHIMRNMLTVDKFEEIERKRREERERQDARKMQGELIAIQALDARQRRLQWIVSAIVGTGTIIVALITYAS